MNIRASGALNLARRLLLPAPAARDGEAGIPGHELTPALGAKAVSRRTTPGRATASRFNERPRQAS